MLGVPVRDATPWGQSEQVGDCAYKVLAQLEHEAAQGALLFHDDTAVRIVSLLPENRATLAAAAAQDVATPLDRTGMHTTALVVKVGQHTAILYSSSRQHAGENLHGLLDQREAGVEKPLVMSDALASNTVADESALIRCHCLAHGRRKCMIWQRCFPTHVRWWWASSARCSTTTSRRARRNEVLRRAWQTTRRRASR
jgi:hypothetical protein